MSEDSDYAWMSVLNKMLHAACINVHLFSRLWIIGVSASNTGLTNAAADKIWWAVLTISTACMHLGFSECDNGKVTKHSLAASLPAHNSHPGTQACKGFK